MPPTTAACNKIMRNNMPLLTPNRLEHAKLLDVFQGEIEKCLSGNRCADDKSQQHRDTEIDRNPGIFHEVIHGHILELIPTISRQTGALSDALCEPADIFSRTGLDQDK